MRKLSLEDICIILTCAAFIILTIVSILLCFDTVNVYNKYDYVESESTEIYYKEITIVREDSENKKQESTTSEPSTSESKDYNIEYFAKCVMSEAGNQDELGKRLVIDVILNRVESDIFPNSVNEVINQEGQFEVVMNNRINKVEPTDDIYNLILEETNNRTNKDILYFRTNHYHSFGTPVLQHQAHYFSK